MQHRPGIPRGMYANAMSFICTALNNGDSLSLCVMIVFRFLFMPRSLSRRKKNLVYRHCLCVQACKYMSRAGGPAKKGGKVEEKLCRLVCVRVAVFLGRRKSGKQRAREWMGENKFSSNITRQPAGDLHSTSANTTRSHLWRQLRFRDTKCSLVCVLINIFFFFFSSQALIHRPINIYFCSAIMISFSLFWFSQPFSSSASRRRR